MDGYSTYMEPPKCEFMATWMGSHTEPYLPQVELCLEGAESPRDYCRIDFSVSTSESEQGKDLPKGKWCAHKNRMLGDLILD